MNADRQPWDDEREKFRSQANEIANALEFVLAEFRRLLNLPASEAESVHPGNLRDVLGGWADATIVYVAGMGMCPHRVRMAMIARLKNATTCLPWH